MLDGTELTRYHPARRHESRRSHQHAEPMIADGVIEGFQAIPFAAQPHRPLGQSERQFLDDAP